jgi:hypothetical protein
MDDGRFDGMVRTLACGVNRRQAIGALMGGAVWGVLGRRSSRAAQPNCVTGEACTKTADCCPTEICDTSIGECIPTKGGGPASCVATGCPISTNPCQEFVCNQQSGECVIQSRDCEQG